MVWNVSTDEPRSPSVTVQPEPRVAWKAQRRTEECVPSSESRRGRKTVALIYGDKVNTRHRKSHRGGWNHNEQDNLKALGHCEPWDETSQPNPGTKTPSFWLLVIDLAFCFPNSSVIRFLQILKQVQANGSGSWRIISVISWFWCHWVKREHITGKVSQRGED